MAASWGDAHAIWSADAAAQQASRSSRSTRSGWVTAHSTARIPPIEPPSTAAHDPIPSWSASRTSRATWSRTLVCGNREPQGRPSGAGDAGPVVPWHPPRTLGATTNHRSVSIASPGPTIAPHHPGVGCPSPAGPVTWLSPVSACRTSTALSPRKLPHVS